MENFYAYCAVIAGTLLVGQLLMSLIGLGHDSDLHDFSHVDVDVDVDIDGAVDGFDHGGEWFVGILSFRAIVAALTVFGLVGLGATAGELSRFQAFFVSLLAGGSVLYSVGWLMKSLHRLRSEGTAHIEHSIGETGAVYLSIPAEQSGTGKVSVKVQGRTMEYRAMTSEEKIPTGTPVVVVAVIAPGIVEVTKASQPSIEEESHV